MSGPFLLEPTAVFFVMSRLLLHWLGTFQQVKVNRPKKLMNCIHSFNKNESCKPLQRLLQLVQQSPLARQSSEQWQAWRSLRASPQRSLLHSQPPSAGRQYRERHLTGKYRVTPSYSHTPTDTDLLPQRKVAWRNDLTITDHVTRDQFIKKIKNEIVNSR